MRSPWLAARGSLCTGWSTEGTMSTREDTRDLSCPGGCWRARVVTWALGGLGWITCSLPQPLVGDDRATCSNSNTYRA